MKLSLIQASFAALLDSGNLCGPAVVRCVAYRVFFHKFLFAQMPNLIRLGKFCLLLQVNATPSRTCASQNLL